MGTVWTERSAGGNGPDEEARTGCRRPYATSPRPPGCRPEPSLACSTESRMWAMPSSGRAGRCFPISATVRDGAARSLRTRASMILGVVISDVTNSFFTAVVRGAEDRARPGRVFNGPGQRRRRREQGSTLPGGGGSRAEIAGVLLSPASRQTSIDVLFERGIPVVTIDRHLASASVKPAVHGEQSPGRPRGDRRLIGQGCVRVGMIARAAWTTTGAAALGLPRRAARARAEPGQELTEIGDFRTDGGYAATKKLLRLPRPPDGLLISNDLMTLGALQAIARGRPCDPRRHRHRRL